MRWTFLAPAVSLAAALAAPAAAASVSDFRLPPAQQPPPSDRQGPVAPDVPESRGPTPTPAPTASRTQEPTPAPTAAEPRIVVPDLAPPAGSQRTGTVARVVPTATASAPATETPPADAGAADTVGLPAASSAPAAASPGVPAPETEGGSLWPWLLGILAALGVLGFAGWMLTKQRRFVVPATVPQLERLRPAPPPSPDPVQPPPSPALAANTSEPLRVTLEPLRLSLTLINATLAYRLVVANRGAAAIERLSVGADMISAHASLTREQQLSGPAGGAATVQRIERLAPGESTIVEGEFRVPFSQIVPIRQGNAALLLPLARFRLEAEGAAPVVRTFVVGQPGENAALQPFRLDLGPRIYPTLVQRAFA